MTIEIAAADAAGALRYDDVRSEPIKLTPAEQELYMKKVEALRKILTDSKIKAKYKIEIMFGKARSMSNPTPGVLSFWNNGNRFHGGGDEKLYLCPGSRLGKNSCTALIQDAFNSSRGVVCPNCGSIWTQEALIGELLFRLPMRKWADVVYHYFRLCEYDSDIYLKYAPDDIRSVTRDHMVKQTWRGAERLDKTRAKRARMIYPLKHIIKDTSAGADLLGRFYAFLVA